MIDSNPQKIKITKAIDLINRVAIEPEPKILWNGIPEGSKGLVVGVSKTGKTTLAENLAFSLAVGRKDFFGKPLSGEPEKVLFINLEESYRVRSRRNAKQILELTDSEKEYFNENYISTPEDFPEFFESNEDWQYAKDYIEASEANIVFIDSLSHMFKGQIEATEPSVLFVKKFREYIATGNKTIIVVHHNTKGNDKPIEQDSIAGSRIIAQEFEYAIGLGNIPTEQGGSYMCTLFNKYVENDSTLATLYKVSPNNWVQNLTTTNKFELYKDAKFDYRTSTSNKDSIYDYIVSQSSQDSSIVETAELKKHFVDSSRMSKETFHKNINQLVTQNRLFKPQKGQYQLKVGNNE